MVIFTSDHGDHLGDHRLMLKGAEQYQSIVRVPFIWSDPQGGATGQRTDALASTMDIGATVLERAKIEPASGMQAKSLLPVIERGKAVRDSRVHPVRPPGIEPGHQRAAARAHADRRPLPAVSVFHGTGWGELYDLRERSGRVRQSLGRSGARQDARAR